MHQVAQAMELSEGAVKYHLHAPQDVARRARGAVMNDDLDPLDETLSRGLSALAPSEFELDADAALGSMRPAFQRARARRRLAISSSALGVVAVLAAVRSCCSSSPLRTSTSDRTRVRPCRRRPTDVDDADGDIDETSTIGSRKRSSAAAAPRPRRRFPATENAGTVPQLDPDVTGLDTDDTRRSRRIDSDNGRGSVDEDVHVRRRSGDDSLRQRPTHARLCTPVTPVTRRRSTPTSRPTSSFDSRRAAASPGSGCACRTAGSSRRSPRNRRRAKPHRGARRVFRVTARTTAPLEEPTTCIALAEQSLPPR